MVPAGSTLEEMPKMKPLERGEAPVTREGADKETVRESVVERRVPGPASLPSVKTFRSGVFARLLASRSAARMEQICMPPSRRRAVRSTSALAASQDLWGRS